jgi:AcrR family transcriptional regulator
MSIVDTPPENRAERRKQRTRLALIAAASELLQERGYVNVTLQAITDRADVGYGTFYLHFKDKDDILWAVLQVYFQQVEQEINSSLAEVPYPRREYLSWVAIFQNTANFHRQFLDIFTHSAVLSQRYLNLLTESHRRNLLAGRYQSPIDLPLDFMVEFSAGALWRLMFWYAETPARYTPEEMASMLFVTIFREPPPA